MFKRCSLIHVSVEYLHPMLPFLWQDAGKQEELKKKIADRQALIEEVCEDARTDVERATEKMDR